MHFHHLRNRLALIVIGFACLPCVVFGDQLIMNNGDIISGDINKIVDGKVYIDPSYGDEYAVDLAEVTSIDAEKEYAVELTDGRKVEAQFAGASEGEQNLIVDEQPISIGLSELAQAAGSMADLTVDLWDGEGEFGFVSTTGNTETEAMNLRLNFVRTSEQWRHRFTGTAITSSKDGTKDNERYTVEVQSDRKMSDKNWLFGALRWDSDKFGSYDPQISLTAGYGRMLMQSDRHELKGEIGAGYRKQEETSTGETSDDAIARFLLDDWWQVFPSTKWTNRLLIESGSSNTFTQFNSGLAVSMTDRMAVKLGFEVRYNSELPPDSLEHTDTITSANLVYDF